MLARARGGEQLIAVQFVGGGDIDCVDPRVLHERVEIAGRAANSVLVGVVLRAAGVGAQHRYDLAAIRAYRSDHVLASDRAPRR
jgi:hypothetical protein